MSKNYYAVYAVSANGIMKGDKFSAQDMIKEKSYADITNSNATRQGLEQLLSRPQEYVGQEKTPGFGYHNNQQVFMPSVVVSARIEPSTDVEQRMQHDAHDADRLTIHPAGHGGHVTNNTTVNGVTTMAGLGLYTNDTLANSTELDSRIIIGADALHKAEVVYDPAEVPSILEARQMSLQKIVDLKARSSLPEMSKLDLNTPNGLDAVRFAYSPDGFCNRDGLTTIADRYSQQFFNAMAQSGSAALVAQLPEMHKEYTKHFQELQEKYPNANETYLAANAMRRTCSEYNPMVGEDSKVMTQLQRGAENQANMMSQVLKDARSYLDAAGISHRSEFGKAFMNEVSVVAMTHPNDFATNAREALDNLAERGVAPEYAEEYQSLSDYVNEVGDNEVEIEE